MLDSGPIFPEISVQKHTKSAASICINFGPVCFKRQVHMYHTQENSCYSMSQGVTSGPWGSKMFRPETHRSKVIYRGPNSVPEISVQSPAFPGPKSSDSRMPSHQTLFKSVPTQMLPVEFNGIVETTEQSYFPESCFRYTARVFLLVQESLIHIVRIILREMEQDTTKLHTYYGC